MSFVILVVTVILLGEGVNLKVTFKPNRKPACLPVPPFFRGFCCSTSGGEKNSGSTGCCMLQDLFLKSSITTPRWSKSNQKLIPNKNHNGLRSWKQDNNYNPTKLLLKTHPNKRNEMFQPFFKWAMKKNWLFSVYRGWNPTQLCGDYFINHDIRIPFLNNQMFNPKIDPPNPCFLICIFYWVLPKKGLIQRSISSFIQKIYWISSPGTDRAENWKMLKKPSPSFSWFIIPKKSIPKFPQPPDRHLHHLPTFSPPRATPGDFP